MPMQLFALETYDMADGEPVSPPDLPPVGSTSLISLVRLPEDEVLLALVEGPDADTVSACMAAAGWRVDRITAATLLWPTVGSTSDQYPASDPEVSR